MVLASAVSLGSGILRGSRPYFSVSLLWKWCSYLHSLQIWAQVLLYCHALEWLQTVFLLDIGFVDHLYTRLGTSSNYSATANLHALQMTTAHAKSLPACCVFTSRSLVTATNSGGSSASALKFSLHSLPYKTDFVAPIVFLIIPQHEPSRKHRFQQNLYCCMRIRYPHTLTRERVYRAVA
jgi:hypothetical protein